MPAESPPDQSPGDDVPRQLVEAAAHLLAEQGPSALSARKLAAATGTSTMAVYTHFGGMPGVVRAVVAEGFRRLHDRVGAVAHTGDTLHDLTAAAAAYRQHALANPHLYAVMFGSASLGELRLHDDELAVGLEAFGQIVSFTQRAMDAGALRSGDATAVAARFWLALHGYVMAELAEMHTVVDDPEGQVLWPMLAALVAAHAPPST